MIYVNHTNDLYKTEWRFYFFMPSVKLLEKKGIASKTIKRYYTPKTPYQSIFGSPHISDAGRQDVKNEFDQLSPFKLKKTIEKKIAKIFKYLR